MKVNIFDVDKFIQANNLQEVTNPILFDRGFTPTDDGLYSYSIFGRPGTNSRKTTFAYISLNAYYFHPLVYKVLIQLNRKFEECIAGIGNFKLNENGELIKTDSEDEGETGIDFLYKNWEKINFKKTEALDRQSRLKLINKLKKNEIFMKKFIIIPPHYRDVNFLKADSGKIGHDELNDMYCKLLRLSKASQETNLVGISFMGNSTKSKIQKILLSIYEYFTKSIKGKDGLFHQSVLGKSIDLGIRTVITSPIFTSERYENMPVKMDFLGVPLSQCCVAFFPFIRKWIMDWFMKFDYIKVTPNTKGKQVNTPNVLDQYNYDTITKCINTFIKSPSERFNPITIKTENGDKKYFQKMSYESGELLKRYMTWTDLLYQAAVEVCKGKHVYVTRYPLTDYFQIFASKVTVLSTVKTQEMTIGDKTYKHYPVIDTEYEKHNIGNLFVDSVQLPNVMCPALGADFDGDQITVRGVFTQEANLEAEKNIYSPRNILTITSSNIRKITNEGVQSLYNLTKD